MNPGMIAFISLVAEPDQRRSFVNFEGFTFTELTLP
jgi:hypothetical protein